MVDLFFQLQITQYRHFHFACVFQKSQFKHVNIAILTHIWIYMRGGIGVSILPLQF